MIIERYTGVMRLAGCYAAVHVQGEKKSFISGHPEINVKVAETAAKIFAAHHQIPYYPNVLELDIPPITVIKKGSIWYPVELESEKIYLLMEFGSIHLGGTKEEAVNMARIIALSKKADFLPSIGISLSREE